MKNKKKIVLVVILTWIGIAIASIFWILEIQYRLPTTVPQNHSQVAIGSEISIQPFLQDKRPKLLHFYNPSCPCSKFNTAHIKELYSKYRKDISFYVVSEKEINKARNEFEFTIVEDTYGALADACGVYATPQAVLLDQNNKIYYRGNYNKERYCTAKNTNFAEIAIRNLLDGDQKKQFSSLAIQSYGCQLLSDIKK